MDDILRLKKRMQDLEDQSNKHSTYYFTDFLSPAEASCAYEVCNSSNFSVWGGNESCERVMIRFGNPKEFGYEVDFPIKILSIIPVNKKYSDKLTHRDFLGSLMNLGIERAVLGDIFVKDNEGYVFTAERMCDYIKESLFRVRHTDVACEIMEKLPEYIGPSLEEQNIIASSDRIDGIISKLYKFSRSESKEIISKSELFVNGRICTNPSIVPKENDIISVRHYGKFIFKGISHETKKGNVVISIAKYM